MVYFLLSIIIGEVLARSFLPRHKISTVLLAHKYYKPKVRVFIFIYKTLPVGSNGSMYENYLEDKGLCGSKLQAEQVIRKFREGTDVY